MSLRRWLELIKDYDCEINYYLGKANVVANALSRKSTIKFVSLGISQPQLIMELETLKLEVVGNGKPVILSTMVI
jgi:hypothetical protein